MSAKVISLRRPKSFTSAEELLDNIRISILEDGRTYKQLAALVNVGHSTIHNIASGKTHWPRQTTLFPLIQVLGLELTVTKRR